MLSNTIKLFVYGTLRKHESNYFLMNGNKLIAEQAWVYGELYDTGLGYPSMKVQGLESKVYGELYEINSESISALDELEDYIPGRKENLYNRILQDIHTDTGVVQAFVYVSNKDELLIAPILHGDWKLYRLVDTKPDKILYFAYGSCMDTARFQAANSAQYFEKVRGAGVLKGYSMKYTFAAADGGRADIMEDGGTTEGIVYEIPYDAVAYLYEREGFYAGWYRPTFVDILVEGKKVITNVLTFHVYEKRDELAPPKHYATEILRGAKGRVSEQYYQSLLTNLLHFGIEN